MGDRVAVMRDGRLEQLDTPQALYDRPADLFVAGFIGSPAMNFVQRAARGLERDARRQLRLERARAAGARRCRPRSPATGADVIIGLRPEHLDLAVNGSNGKPVLRAPVTLAEPVGAQVIVHLDLETLAVAEQGGDFCACLDSRRVCSRGETLTLAVDPATLHFFDPETETALR